MKSLLGLAPEATDQEVLDALKNLLSNADTAGADDDEGGVALSVGKIATLAVKGEQMRLTKIKAIARGMHLSESWTAKQIESGQSFEQASQSAIEERMRLDAMSTPQGYRVDASPRRDAASNREVLACATLLHLGKHGVAEKSCDKSILLSAKRLDVRHAYDLSRAALHLAGMDTSGGENQNMKLSFSTASLPSALGLAGEKIMLQAWAAAPATWRSWCGVKSAKTLRAHTHIRGFLGSSDFEEIGPTGEIKHGSANESTFTTQAHTYGKQLSIARHHIVNDDLGIIDSLFSEVGMQQPRKIADLVYTALLGSAGSFFSAANGNYIQGATTAMSYTGLDLAIQTIRKQTDEAGRPIALTPKTLVVCPEIEALARQLVASTIMSRESTSDQAATGNPFVNLIQIEVEPRLSATGFHANVSTKAWYLFGDPNATPAMLVTFVNGVETPVVETADEDFDRLGSRIRAYSDFGADLGDHRAGVLSLGEAE